LAGRGGTRLLMMVRRPPSRFATTHSMKMMPIAMSQPIIPFLSLYHACHQRVVLALQLLRRQVEVYRPMPARAAELAGAMIVRLAITPTDGIRRVQ